MSFAEDRRVGAVRALPDLSRTLFLLHNFYNVEIAAMAEGLGTDVESIAACLAEARIAILHHRRYPATFKPGQRVTTALTEGLQGEYRASLEAAFEECGYVGVVPWSHASVSVIEDQEAAASFIVSMLHQSLRKAAARLHADGIAVTDLWRRVRPWQRVRRNRLLQVDRELRCSGWQTFESWLADRVAPECHYPEGYALPRRLRRPLPEAEDPAWQRLWLPHWPDDPDRQARFDKLPSLTQQVYGLFELGGRNSHEIARRLDISRRGVRRRHDRACYAVAGWTYPGLAWHIDFAVRMKCILWRSRVRKAWAALRE